MRALNLSSPHQGSGIIRTYIQSTWNRRIRPTSLKFGWNKSIEGKNNNHQINKNPKLSPNKQKPKLNQKKPKRQPDRNHKQLGTDFLEVSMAMSDKKNLSQGT